MSKLVGTIGGRMIIAEDDGTITFSSGATIDGDGANGQFGGHPCYAPEGYSGVTLDVLGNAGSPGNWFGIATDNGQADGNPVVQGSQDPCPGAYVSTTSLELHAKNGEHLPDSSPFKYVDSFTVPYIVVPPLIVRDVPGVVMGCRAVVTNRKTGQKTEAVVADGGPSDHLGEISVACAKAIGVPVGTNHAADGGGADSPDILYRIFPGVPAVVNGFTYPLQRS